MAKLRSSLLASFQLTGAPYSRTVYHFLQYKKPVGCLFGKVRNTSPSTPLSFISYYSLFSNDTMGSKHNGKKGSKDRHGKKAGRAPYQGSNGCHSEASSSNAASSHHGHYGYYSEAGSSNTANPCPPDVQDNNGYHSEANLSNAASPHHGHYVQDSNGGYSEASSSNAANPCPPGVQDTSDPSHWRWDCVGYVIFH